MEWKEMAVTTEVDRSELLARLRSIRESGLDAKRFVRSALEDREISASTAKWLLKEMAL